MADEESAASNLTTSDVDQVQTLPPYMETAESVAPLAVAGDISVEAAVVSGAIASVASAPSLDMHTGDDALLQEIRDNLAGLRRDFESKLMYDVGKQRQLDTMHEELEAYRRGFHLQILRPVLTDLIALYGDMDKVVERLNAAGQNGTAQEIVHFRDQIEESLRRVGVERFTTAGDEFDAKRQRAVAAIVTSEPASDKQVAEHLRPGFEYEGRVVVQAEQVTTYRYMPQSPAE